MDPELKKEFDAIRADIAGNAELVSRVDSIEQAAVERSESLTKIGAELEAVRSDYEALKAEVEKAHKASRLVVQRAEGVQDREHGLVILAAQAREIICRATGATYPSRYASEQDLLRDFERATLEAGATGGSYLVPTVTSAEIVDTLEEVSELVSLTDFRVDLPGNVDLPTLTGRPSLQHARASVDTAMTASDPTFGQLQVRPDEGYIYFGVDNRLLQMSPIALGSMMLELVRDGIVGGLANDLLNGDGTSTYNSITGFLNEATAAYLYTLGSGDTAFQSLAKADLTAILAKCLKRGRATGRWVMSLYILGLIQDMDRTGKAQVYKEDAQGNPMVLGRPVVIDEGMPDEGDSAAATAFLGFGDLRTYLIGLVQGIQLAQSQHDRFAKNQTTFRGLINFDIKRKPVATFITAKTAAA